MTTLRPTARAAVLAVAAAAVAVTGAATASAATTTYSQPGGITIGSPGGAGANGTTITIPDSGAGSLYPSPITLSGIGGPVTDVNLTLSGFQHTCERDVDFLLVGPQGQKALVMSDAGNCPQAPVSAVNITLDDSASDPLPIGAPLTSGTFRPGDNDYGVAEPDPFPAPAPDPDAAGTGSALSVFNGTDPNGTWNLYVSDQYAVDSGQLGGGWSLDVASAGTAAPYPSTVGVSGARNGITDVNVTLRSLDHTYPDDVDVLLVGPQGQKAILMSDVGGNDNATDVNLTFDDEAAAALPDSSVVSGTYRPVNYGPELGDPTGPDSFPGPAADASAVGSNLSVFDGTNPNGTWSLYVVDDYANDSGDFSGGWSLQISTVDAPAAPTITAPPNNTRDRDGAFTMTGTAPASTTVTIYDGASLKTTVGATAAGQWTAPISGVPNGSHTFTAKATDGFGNVSAASAGVVVIIDSIKPQIVSTVPAKGAKHASVRANIKARASEALRAATVTKANVYIVVAGTTTHLKARVTWRPLTHTIVINPKVNLDHGTKYKVTITTRVLDLAGNPLDQNRTKTGLQKKTWKFTTR